MRRVLDEIGYRLWQLMCLTAIVLVLKCMFYVHWYIMTGGDDPTGALCPFD